MHLTLDDAEEIACDVLHGRLALDVHLKVDARQPIADLLERDNAVVLDLAVDLRLVTFIDSTTLAQLLAASRRQHAQGGELLILVGPQTPMTAFEVTGFDRLLAIRRLDDEQRNIATHAR